MFGQLVPVNNEYWELIVTFLDYFEILMAYKYDQSLTYFMDEIYQEFLEKINLLFTDDIFKPKMHFALHYGTQTRLFGPSRIRYTLRYESKHSSLKQPLLVSKNRKNVCKSLSERHQFKMYLKYEKKNLFPDTCEYSPVNGHNEYIKCLSSHIQIALFPHLGSTKIVYRASGFRHSQGSYYINDIVILGSKYDTYIFGKIENIFFIIGVPYIFCKEYITVQFSTHLHAYEVSETFDRYTLIQLKDLLDHHVLGIYEVGGSYFIPLKHYVPKSEQ